MAQSWSSSCWLVCPVCWFPGRCTMFRLVASSPIRPVLGSLRLRLGMGRHVRHRVLHPGRCTTFRSVASSPTHPGPGSLRLRLGMGRHVRRFARLRVARRSPWSPRPSRSLSRSQLFSSRNGNFSIPLFLLLSPTHSFALPFTELHRSSERSRPKRHRCAMGSKLSLIHI